MYLSKMNNILIKVLALVLVACMLFSLVSCDFIPTAGHGTPKEDFPLFTMIMTTVVGGDGIGFVHRLEEDEYGRILFDFGVENLLTWYYNCGINGYGICQKIENGYAFYYEDFCYVGAESLDDISHADIEELKKNNDWGQEQDQSKRLTGVRSFEKPYDENIFDIGNGEEKNALAVFGDMYSISKEELENYEIRPSARDANGKTLFYIATAEEYENNRPKTSKIYAIIVDSTGNASETSVLKIDDPYNCSETLRAFKLVNGWER